MAVHTGQLNGLALCAGNGGLELGLQLALGERYKTVCYVEREAYNVRSLVARMEEKTLDFAPVWDDLTTFDGKAWCGIVDIISAGFPCQPHSTAGHRKGIEDERWLWDSIHRIIGEVLPDIVWLENVPNLAYSGLDKVLGSLSEAGYNSVWDTFSAEEAGASQRRERLSILSYRHSGGSCSRAKSIRRTARANINRRSAESEMVFATGDRRETRSIGETLREFKPSIFDVAHGISERRQIVRQIGSSRRSPIIQAGDFIFPPFRDDTEGWRKYLISQSHLEPSVLRGSDGIANRVDRLRTIGNGVVPIVVAYAFVTLIQTALSIEK